MNNTATTTAPTTTRIWDRHHAYRINMAHADVVRAEAYTAAYAAYDAVTSAHTYNPAATPALLAAIEAANAAHAVAVAAA